MVSKTTIVIATLFVAFLLYSVLNVLSTEHQSEDDYEKYEIIGENKIIYDDTTYWTGLPISPGNYFYIEPSDKTKRDYEEYKGELLNLIGVDTDEKMEAVYDKYYKIIGINGIFDGVNEFEHELGHSALIHHMGEYVYSKVMEEETGNVTYGIEICSRNILSKAPLHGYVWSAINASSNQYLKGFNDEERIVALSDPLFLQFLFNFVDEKLCYFKTTPNISKIYSSCLHGVGHGLSDVFGEERISNAIGVCGMRNNHDFNYLCATGIYMDVVPHYKNFTPCDINRYPASCFRFQSNRFDLIKAFDNISNFCSVFKDNRYLELGCVWGYNYMDHKTHYTHAYDVCKEFEVDEIEGFLDNFNDDFNNNNNNNNLNNKNDPDDELKYKNRLYLACVDGFLTQSKIKKAEERLVKKTCKKFKQHKYIMDYCYQIAKPLKDAESEDEDGENWNFQLLEYDYNPKIALHQVQMPENIAMLLNKVGKDNNEENHENAGHQHG